jgi:hypothetical protein
MTDQKEPILDLETERSLNAQCLALEMPGQTWHVPFNSLQGIPRVGEKIRFAGGSSGKVVEVEYEFAPEEAAPVEVAREMPDAASYARPVRIVIRLSWRVRPAHFWARSNWSAPVLTFAVTGTVPLEKTPRGLEFDPNGRRLYITQAGSESVAVVDPRQQ